MPRGVVALVLVAVAVRSAAAAAETAAVGFRRGGVWRAISAGVGPTAPPGFSTSKVRARPFASEAFRALLEEAHAE